MKFRDRTHAGRVLASMLQAYKGKSCVVLGLPNGGIPVGLEIAKDLDLEFDLLFISKITPKFNTEIGYGSVSESGVINVNEPLVRKLGLTTREVEQDIEKTMRKVKQRLRSYTLNGGRRDITKKAVLLVDDGLASGFTMMNAIDTVRRKGAGEITVAVPTAPLSTYNRISEMTEAIVCPDIRDTDMFAVAEAYANWYDISFEGALRFLQRYGYMAEGGVRS